MSVPFLRLQNEFDELKLKWMNRLEHIGDSGAFILGPHVRAFEAEAATYLGSHYGIGLANGTDALELSLRALDIGPGDQVITTPFTFFATAEAISKVGAEPVFADIDPNNFTLDPDSVAQRLNPKVKAILPVHIFGHPADMGSLSQMAEQHGLALIEDGAQAFGAESHEQKVGSIGHCGCFSFYPTKVLGCYGDGGYVSTSDETVRDRLHKLRNHGATAPFTHDELGYNSRLDEVQAALLRLKLEKIEQDIAARIAVADRYDELLANSAAQTPTRPEQGRHVFNLYTIRHPRRDVLMQALREQNIGCSQCYPRGLHLQQVFEHLNYQKDDLPVTDRLCTETLSLPIFPEMQPEEIEEVCEVVKHFD